MFRMYLHLTRHRVAKAITLRRTSPALIRDNTLKIKTATPFKVRRLTGSCLLVFALISTPAQSAFAREALSVACFVPGNELGGRPGSISDMRDLPGGGVLIGDNTARGVGLFLAHMVDGRVIVESAGDTKTGRVWRMGLIPGAGVLVHAEEGLF